MKIFSYIMIFIIITTLIIGSILLYRLKGGFIVLGVLCDLFAFIILGDYVIILFHEITGGKE